MFLRAPPFRSCICRFSRRASSWMRGALRFLEWCLSPARFICCHVYLHLLASQVISKNAPVSLEVLPDFEADVAAYNTDIA